MNTLTRHITVAAIMLTGVIAQTSCIDDDLRDCEDSYQLHYDLQLVTNLTTELQTELTTQTDLQIASALRGYLSGVFTDFAHDADLSFYDTEGDSARLQHDEHIMDANQASYTLNLPMRQYMHLAVANVIDNDLVTLRSDDRCHTATLVQTDRDSIDSHTTGLFTARLPMEVLEGIDQQFDVHLYMANCASALVVDTTGSGIRNLRVVATGFATAFRVADSTFVYGASPIVRAEEIGTGSDGSQTFCAVTFPSPESTATRTIIETTDPFVKEGGTDGLWEIRAYATGADGTTTETRLSIYQPLRAGQLRIVKAQLHPDGSITTGDQSIGVSVTLHWNENNMGDIPLE